MSYAMRNIKQGKLPAGKKSFNDIYYTGENTDCGNTFFFSVFILKNYNIILFFEKL